MEIHAQLNSQNLKFLIVVSKFNELITEKLKEGAHDCIVQLGGNPSDIDAVWVPGAYEIPYLVKKVAKTKKYDGIIALGCVIKGETAHFDYVAGPVANAIMNISLDSEVPISFGILTTQTIEQALERAGTKHGNKGWDAAKSVIEMISLEQKMKI